MQKGGLGRARRAASCAYAAALAAACLVMAPAFVRAEHGMPGYDIGPEGDTIPLSGRVFVHNSNGVAWGLDALRAARPTLVGGGDRLPLSIVDQFDDMEGHTVPFDAGQGYGESLIILAPARPPGLAPARPLKPGATYQLRLEGESPLGAGAELGRWRAARVADKRPPAWKARPYLADIPERESDRPALVVPVAPEATDVFIEIVATPVGAGRPKRLLVPLARYGADETACRPVYVWDHANGVSGYHVHRDTARRFRATLAAIDHAGNRRAAPGPPIELLWPEEPLEVCVPQPGTKAPKRVKTPAPRWRAAPWLSTVSDGTPPRPTLRLHAPVAPSRRPLYVEVEVALEQGGPARRLIAALPPEEPGELTCARLRIADGLPRQLREDGAKAHALFRLAVIDEAGRRAVAPDPPLALDWGGDWPHVCLSAPGSGH